MRWPSARSAQLDERPVLEELVDIYTNDAPAYERGRQWRFKAALAHGPSDCFNNVLATLVLAAIFAPQVALLPLASWFTAINAVAFSRLWIYAAHRRAHGTRPGRLERLFVISLALEGALWGIAFYLFAADGPAALRAGSIIWLAGVGAWIIGAYSFVVEGVIAFLIAELVPVAAYLLMTGDGAWQLVAAGFVLWVPAMAMIAVRNNALIMRGAITQFEKEELAQALEDEKRAIDALNADLEADIIRREKVEADLIQAKETAEALAHELEKLSSLDGLTGIANRRRFDETMAREWGRVQRAGKPLALIMCDIDYFKQYNDQYGHQAGDACLRQLAILLDAALRRGGDLAARYGGEEFAILLPETDVERAANIADNIRTDLYELGMPHESSLVAPVMTASFGVAALTPARDNTPDALVQLADRALYSAKREGRNRVVQMRADGLGKSARSEHLLH